MELQCGNILLENISGDCGVIVDQDSTISRFAKGDSVLFRGDGVIGNFLINDNYYVIINQSHIIAKLGDDEFSKHLKE